MKQVNRVIIKTFGKVFAAEKAIPLLYLLCVFIILLGFYPLKGLNDIDKLKKNKDKNFFKGFKDVMSGSALKFVIYNTIIGFGAGLVIPFLISIAFPQGVFIMGLSFFLRSTLMNLNQPLIQNISLETVDYDNRALMSSIISMSSNATRAISMIIAGYLIGTAIFYRSFNLEKKPLRGGIE